MKDSNEKSPAAGEASQETDLRRLLQAAGRRQPPSETLMEETRAVVAAEWRSVVAQRKRRRQGVLAFAAAACVLAAVAGWLWRVHPVQVGTGAAVATVERIAGQTMYGAQAAEPAQALSRALVLSQTLHVGEQLATSAGGRVAMRWHDGVSVRLDRDTEISLLAADRLALQKGALYVDSGPSATTQPLFIQTPYGEVRHLGTQYETRTEPSVLQVSVREGRVEVSAHGGTVVQAGTRLTLAADGRMQSQLLGAHDPAWDWIGAISPPFVIDGRPLTEFLAWVSRELGREIVFANAASEEQARGVILRGSIDGLTPEQALPAVLSTTRLHSVPRDEKILIESAR